MDDTDRASGRTNLIGRTEDYCAILPAETETRILVSLEMYFTNFTSNPSLTFRYILDKGVSLELGGRFEYLTIEMLYKESSGGHLNTS